MRRVRVWVGKSYADELHTNVNLDDPELELQQLNFGRQSKLFVASDTACNVFEFLKTEPKKVTVVNPHASQMALMRFKKNFFERGDYDKLFVMFGKGFYRSAASYYQKFLRQGLPHPDRVFWDEQIKLFANRKKPGGYYFGKRAGEYPSRFFKTTFQDKSKLALVKHFYNGRLSEKDELCTKIDDRIVAPLAKISQQRMEERLLARRDYKHQLALLPAWETTFKKRLSFLIRKLPAEALFLWKNFFFGYFTKSECPFYLKQENFDFIQENVHKIAFHEVELQRFFTTTQKRFTHFVFSDHLDAFFDKPNELALLFKSVIKKAHPGAEFLIRSNCFTYHLLLQLLPNMVELRELTQEEILKSDRIGLHTKVFVGRIGGE